MASIPEEAVVDAVLFDSLGAATLLTLFAERPGAPISANLLVEICRDRNISSQRVHGLAGALERTGVLRLDASGFSLAVSPDEAARHAAVLRGVGYAQYRQQDANRVEITLSPPAQPSRLMEVLPKQGFSWARLYHTKDSLIELASLARKRLVIVSPFLDSDGIEWIGQLFEATSKVNLDRTLIVRGRDKGVRAALETHAATLAAWNANVLSYAIVHDPGTRSPSIETFHAKIVLADSDKAYVGSSNMTLSSRDISMECGVIVEGPGVKPVATLVDAISLISEIVISKESQNY